MTLRRGLIWFFAIISVLLISLASYLSFVDLGRHKARIESLVSDLTGRTFAIEGELKIELVPSVSVVAENAHLSNADWGSKQPMVQVGRLAANVGLRSLFSGRIDVRSVDLRDVTVLLERGRDGKANWRFKEPATNAVVKADPKPEPKADAQADEAEPDKDTLPLPVVIARARLRDVRVIYRERGKRDRVAMLDRLSIEPGEGELLSLEGRGKLNEFPITLDGEAGPLDSLLKGRDIRMDMKGSLGRLALDIKGSFGSLLPLDGADLKIQAKAEDFDGMLERLELPLFANGPLKVDATLADAGEITNFKLDASAGDIGLKASGSLKELQLRGSRVKFEASAADAARLATVFGLSGVPAGPLSASGGIQPLRKEFRFEALQAQLAGVSARVDGKWIRGRNPKAELKFELGVDDLSALHASLPKSKLSASGNFAGSRESIEFANLVTALDANQLTGRVSFTLGEPRRIEADLSSPHFDLTPFLPASNDPQEAGPPKEPKESKEQKESKESKRKFAFSEEPLPIRSLRGTEANLHVAIAELAISNKTLKDVDAKVLVEPARVTLAAGARGSLEGAVQGSLTFEPLGEDAAKLNLKLGLEDVRAGLDMKDMSPTEVPPLDVIIDLTTQGRSPRELASNANGLLVLTQGPGKTRSEFLDAFGGNLLAELRGRLNPFRAQDPFTRLDCTVVRADIVDGAVTVKPILLQSQKVTVVAQGKLDLHTEQLTLDFDTRPRKGIGVSPGMFTNPFIRVEGTMMNPRLAIGAKGMTSGAVAAATGGLSVLASGLIDRLKGGTDMCEKAMKRAGEPMISTVKAALAVPQR